MTEDMYFYRAIDNCDEIWVQWNSFECSLHFYKDFKLENWTVKAFDDMVDIHNYMVPNFDITIEWANHRAKYIRRNHD
jgi:predicted HD phosphohydrolase